MFCKVFPLFTISHLCLKKIFLPIIFSSFLLQAYHLSLFQLRIPINISYLYFQAFFFLTIVFSILFTSSVSLITLPIKNTHQSKKVWSMIADMPPLSPQTWNITWKSINFKKKWYLANITPLTWRVKLTRNFNNTIMQKEEYYIPHKF